MIQGGRAVELPPGFVPWRKGKERRKKGAAIAKGLAYEKKVGAWLRRRLEPLGLRVWDHLWVRDGRHWCQPDFVVESPSGGLLVVEVKYSQCEARGQIERYKRVLGAKTGVQVCRVLKRGYRGAEAFEDLEDGGVFGLWL